jgi:hypothetical protein
MINARSLVIGVLGAAALLATAAQAQPATLSREMLLAIAEMSRDALDDITIDYTKLRTKGLGDDASDFLTAEHIVSDGQRFYAETARLWAPEYGNLAFLRVAATDGKIMSMYDMHRGMAGRRIDDGHSETSVRGREFFGMSMLYDRVDSENPAGAAGSLIGLLSDSNAVVREQQELVHGVSTYVVDLVSPSGTFAMTAWIDPERGCVPLRHEYSMPHRGGKYMEYDVLEIAEVAPGLWLPVQGVKRVMPGVLGEDHEGEEFVISVSKSEDGIRYLIEFNSHPDDSFFDALRVAAPGTLVADEVEGGEYTLGGMNYAALASALQATIRAHGYTPEELISSIQTGAQRTRERLTASDPISSPDESMNTGSQSAGSSHRTQLSSVGGWLLASVAVASGIGIVGALMARRYIHS